MRLSIEEAALCEIVWDYLGEQQDLQQAHSPFDAMIVGGGRDLDVPKEAARLFMEGWASVMVISGTWHRAGGFMEPDKFADIAVAHGVPKECIIKERNARNIGDNIRFSQHKLENHGICPTTLLLVHTPIATRRMKASAEAQWEGSLEACVARHEAVSFLDYLARDGMQDTIPRMIGYVARMEEYAERGFQSPQPIPDSVRAACAELKPLYGSRGQHY